jgi:mRNA interferase YafQ
MKGAEKKRAPQPRSAEYAKAFSKDWERLSATGRFDMRKLKSVMLLIIANDGPLDPEWKDHPLKGSWTGYRECHVGGDFLLIYQINDKSGKSGGVAFERIGTHSELFAE